MDGRLLSGHIIAILAAILFPVFARAREKARQTSCQSNLKQIALAAAMYSADYDNLWIGGGAGINKTGVSFDWPANVGSLDRFGPDRHWPVLLYPYVKNAQLFTCPSSTSSLNVPISHNYAYNFSGLCTRTSVPGRAFAIYQGWPQSMIRQPAETFAFLDARLEHNNRGFSFPAGYDPDIWAEFIGTPEGDNDNRADRHNGMANVAFADGHVKALSRSELMRNVGPVENSWTVPWNTKWR